MRFIKPINTVTCPKKKGKTETSPDWVIDFSIQSMSAFTRYLTGLRFVTNNSRVIRSLQASTHCGPDQNKDIAATMMKFSLW
jgi:hypothetical protein